MTWMGRNARLTYVRANGTVSPSLSPSVASEIVRGSICHFEETEYAEENCDDDSIGDDGSFSGLRSLKVGSGAYAPESSLRNIEMIVLKDIVRQSLVVVLMV